MSDLPLDTIKNAWQDRIWNLQIAVENLNYMIRTEPFIRAAISEHALEFSKLSQTVEGDEITSYVWIGFEHAQHTEKMKNELMERMTKVQKGLAHAVQMQTDGKMAEKSLEDIEHDING